MSPARIEVDYARDEDIVGWIELAAEVAHLFGPLDTREFRASLERAVAGRRAFCIRERNGDDVKLIGAISVSYADNAIEWLAVARSFRGMGYGEALLDFAMARLDRSRIITVQTFDQGTEEGRVARRIYEKHGFIETQSVGVNPAGIPTVMMKKEPR